MRRCVPSVNTVMDRPGKRLTDNRRDRYYVPAYLPLPDGVEQLSDESPCRPSR